MSSIDQRTTETLRAYLREVKGLPNEAAKRQRFAALLGELFPGTKAINLFASGVEKLIRITSDTRIKNGRADSYYGNAIIEFEKSLSATLGEADEQLQEYIAGSWQKDGRATAMVAIASDGVVWRIYRPVLLTGHLIRKENVRLDLLRELSISEETLGEFWLWLTSFLFRPQQVEPTAEQFRLDFGSWSPLYRDGMSALKRAWALAGSGSEANLAYETWQRYLTVTYGSLVESASTTSDPETGAQVSELEGLFLRHTYLVCISRLLIWAMLSRGKSSGTLQQAARGIFSGEYFKSKRLANLVEDDFFHWVRSPKVEKTLMATWERILSHITDYDLSRINEDVLKGIYQELIDPKDRHDLGEYYTPDWLCERIVQEMLPKHGVRPTLDPSCGSGSFLRAAITHYLSNNPGGTDNDRLQEILRNVVGIDIHPVAVTIAKATYVLALGKHINAARKPVHIPIYLADSLFLPRDIEANLLEQISGIEIAFGPKKEQRRIVMPEILVHHPDLFDDAIAACAQVAEGHAGSSAETLQSLRNHLASVAPNLENLQGADQIVNALWDFTEKLADLIRSRKDSIWSFIIRNSYRPAMLRGGFDFIIGNPPWLSYRFVADPDYQDEIKRRAVTLYKIAPTKGKLFTQMELATVFLAHSMATFATPKGRLAFVMPRSVLNADQHQNLIERKYSPTAKFKLTGYWDLRKVQPLFGVPSCVLFADFSTSPGDPSDRLKVLEWEGKLPLRDLSWVRAEKALGAVKKTGTVIYLGGRSALSTEKGDKAKSKPSPYQAKFKQGATIVPRSFYFVHIEDLPSPIDPSAQYWAITDPEQAKQAKKPYTDVNLSGLIEGRFIYTTALSRHLLPFALMKPSPVVLPLESKNGSLLVQTSKQLSDQGFREFGKWMRKAEDTWREKRGSKADKQSLYERLDYQRELTRQSFADKHLVLYNHSGMNVSATYFDRGSQITPFIVDVKLYWAAFDTREEAIYLTAILNSEAVNSAIKPFQSMGLLGERDVHKKVLDLPVPAFDPGNSLHKKLLAAGEEAHQMATLALDAPSFPSGSTLARQRKFVRVQIHSQLERIDGLVQILLGKDK